MNRTFTKCLVILILGLLPLLANAHAEEAQDGFVSGLLHPILGLDHLLAMLGVGIVSVLLGGKNVYVVPALFVILMVTGATMGIYNFQVPFVETGIALSVFSLGLAIAFVKDSRYLIPIMAFVAYFGFLHGYAHGVEMPRAASPAHYGGGFLTSTIVIHLIGVGIGHFLSLTPKVFRILRVCGGVMGAIGLVLIVRTLA